MGSVVTTSWASPTKGGVAPKGKRITPCPETLLGVVTPHDSRSHSLVGQKGVHRELDFWVIGTDPAGVGGKGVGKPAICVPLPLSKLDSYLLHTNHEGVLGLALPPPTSPMPPPPHPPLRPPPPPLPPNPHRGSSSCAITDSSTARISSRWSWIKNPATPRYISSNSKIYF